MPVFQRHGHGAVEGQLLLGQREHRAQHSRGAVVLGVANRPQGSYHQAERPLRLTERVSAGRDVTVEQPFEDVAAAPDLALLERTLAQEPGCGDHGRRVGRRRVDRIQLAMPGVEDHKAKRLGTRGNRGDQQLAIPFRREPHLGASLGRLAQQRLQHRPGRHIHLSQRRRRRRRIAGADSIQGVTQEN